MKNVVKTLRISAWLLTGGTLLVLFSGIFLAKYPSLFGLSPKAIFEIHTKLTPLIFAPLFYIHSLCGLYILSKRHNFLNNKVVQITGAIIWTSFFVFAAVLFVLPKLDTLKNNETIQTKKSINNEDNSTGSSSASKKENSKITSEEVAKHNISENCWMTINNKVYDLTKYLNIHPAGARSMTSYCGKDATKAFETKGRDQEDHSQYAYSLLEQYLVGEVQ